MTDYGLTLDASAWLTHYGKLVGPKGIVWHTLECDAIDHIAEALSARGGWLDNQNLAPQRMTDPVSVVRTIPDGLQGGHIGGPGNTYWVGVEVSGRAGWTPEQWATPKARAAVDHQARAVAGLYIVYGRSFEEIRWLSQAQVKAQSPFGMTDHNGISISGVSRTNHWDVGLWFPFAWALERTQYWFRQMTGSTGSTEELTVSQYEDITGKIDRLEARIFNRAAGSQSLLDEIWFYGNNVILPRLAAILVEVSEFDVVIYRDGGQLWWSEAGQTNHIPDPPTMTDMIYVAEQTGKKIKYWDGNADARPGAFGAHNADTAIPDQRPPVTPS